MALDLSTLGLVAGGSGLAGSLLTKGAEFALGKWLSRRDRDREKTESAVESVPALDATVKDLRESVTALQGLVSKVQKHDWRLDSLERDTLALKTQQDAHRREFEELKSNINLMAQKVTYAEDRSDELKADIRQLGAKLDAFADRVQNLLMERKPSSSAP